MYMYIYESACVKERDNQKFAAKFDWLAGIAASGKKTEQ